MIPFIFELNNIFYNAHILLNIHCTFKKSKKNILEGDFYYEGITADLKNYIVNCERCQATRGLKPVQVPEYPIISNGPHDEYQMDLWYLPKDMLPYTDYKYVMDIVDHFSKWIWSYPLKNKDAYNSLQCLKKFIYSFGICNTLHTDNGLEFKNLLFDSFCAEKGIKHKFSKPYTPNSHGAVESAHKQIKKYVLEEFYINKKEDFLLEDTLLTIINFHNNTEHTTTKHKPIYLRDTSNRDLINEVNNNMKNTIKYAIKYKNLYLLDANDLLLVNSNIKLKFDFKYEEIVKKNKKEIGAFIIPAIFIKYTKSLKLEIKICKKFKNILESYTYYIIESALVREVGEKGFNYYLNN